MARATRPHNTWRARISCAPCGVLRYGSVGSRGTEQGSQWLHGRRFIRRPHSHSHSRCCRRRLWPSPRCSFARAGKILSCAQGSTRPPSRPHRPRRSRPSRLILGTGGTGLHKRRVPNCHRMQWEEDTRASLSPVLPPAFCCKVRWLRFWPVFIPVKPLNLDDGPLMPTKRRTVAARAPCPPYDPRPAELMVVLLRRRLLQQ